MKETNRKERKVHEDKRLRELLRVYQNKLCVRLRFYLN